MGEIVKKNNLLDNAIRKIKDFPKEGILFYDITSILQKPEAFSYCIDEMVKTYENTGMNAVACIEARGFLFAAPFALRMGLPLILIRKKGKLPGKTIEKRFVLEYGEDVIQIHRDDIHSGDKIVVVDDLIATGGTVKASLELLNEAGAKAVDVICVIGLPFLRYNELLADYNVQTLIEYDRE
ncbi:MAG: adenine phosphoribosyltransferase [Spirochaetales bacterium]|nr:adenine phosphoribosyltransferase [Spirochaetales bacterium]